MKKRIVIDARESGTSTGRYIDELVKNLHVLRPSYRVFVLTKKHRVEYMQKIAPRFTVYESNFKEFGFGEQLGFAWQLFWLRPSLVHFAMTQQPVLHMGRTVTTMHDLTTLRFTNPAKNRLVFKIKQWVYERVIMWVAYKSQHIIVPSEYVKDDIAKFTRSNSRKISVTYEAGDQIKDQAEPLDDLKGRQFIMYVGRPTPHKNLRRLIDAYAQLKQKHPDLMLVLTGKTDSNYKRMERYVTKHDIPDVIFTDFVSDGQLRWLYEHCSVYAFPSLSEGFGLPGLEAMACGAPVVSSNATSLPEIYGKAVLYFDPLDVEDIAKQLNRVLSDDGLRKQLNSRRPEAGWQVQLATSGRTDTGHLQGCPTRQLIGFISD